MMPVTMLTGAQNITAIQPHITSLRLGSGTYALGKVSVISSSLTTFTVTTGTFDSV